MIRVCAVNFYDSFQLPKNPMNKWQPLDVTYNTMTMNYGAMPSTSHLDKSQQLQALLYPAFSIYHTNALWGCSIIFQQLPSFRSRRSFLWSSANTGTGLSPQSNALMSHSSAPRSACIQHELLLRGQRPPSFICAIFLPHPAYTLS